MSNDAEIKKVTFRISDAIRLSADYIRRRLERTFINIASVALANSFLSSMILTDLFLQTYNQLVGSAYASDTYQYWLVVVALLVSIVGITNAMLISVYERYREIGTMKCIGALDQHIMMLFLIESTIQGLVGGIIGFFMGILAALFSTGAVTGYDIIFYIPFSQIFYYFVGTTLLSGVLSIAASLYPAYKASKLPPVEALRYEI